MPQLDPDRLFPVEPKARDLARALYDGIKGLPILSPHGHTDPAWYAENRRFDDPAALFVTPDHYVLRMLISQGVRYEDLGVAPRDGSGYQTDPREVWQTFAQHYYLFRATPTRMWIDHALQHVFDISEELTPETAGASYDQIAAALSQPGFRPRALYNRFGVEVVATTDSALDPLSHHKAIAASDWQGRVLPTYRPDAVIDPETAGFAENLVRFGELTGEDTGTWAGYLAAHRKRRADFIALGATATDHGAETPQTANLSESEAKSLFDRVRHDASLQDAALFRAQMLTEMARMSIDDGLVMQLHAGSARSHSTAIHQRYGADKGFDIPIAVDWVNGLHPLLEAFGNDPRLTLILFTLDEATYTRELAPLAGAYPALRLGPAWWFFDSPEGMRRYREAVTETAGFYNTVGFNDDTRAFCSIPARHDVARRVDCAYLADLILTGRLSEADAQEVAVDLAYTLAKKAYRL
ncbi:MAG: glucuronate isomerase [Pseudomonadota bacterium]